MLPIIPRLLLASFCLLSPAISACAAAQLEAVLTTQVAPSGEPLNQADSFTVDTPRILCSVRTAGVPPSTEVKLKWLHNDGGNWSILHEEVFSAGNSSYIVFAVNAPQQGWQPGDYAVKLYVNHVERPTRQFSIKQQEGVPLPFINNFSATPLTVTLGQPFTLSWNVSGASRVVVEPDIGSVGAGGSRLLSPKADTTYTIKAVNSGGSSSSSLSVKVLPPEMEKPDLVITDIFRESVMVYYKVKNEGSVPSRPCNARLYMGTTQLATDYVAPLEPGEQRTEVFGQYTWSFLMTTPATVCIDVDNQNDERNEDNNCLSRPLAGVQVL